MPPPPPVPGTKPPNRFAGCIQGCVLAFVVFVGFVIYLWWGGRKIDKADKEHDATLAEFSRFNGAKGPPANASDDSQARYRKGHLIIMDAGSGKFDESFSSVLPATLKATSAGDVGTEVWLTVDAQPVGHYDNGGIGYKTSYDVIVYDVARNAIVARERIVGDDPPPTIHTRQGSDFGWNVRPTDKVVKFLEDLPAR